MPSRRTVTIGLLGTAIAVGVSMAWSGRPTPGNQFGFGKTSTAEDVTAGLDLTGKNILVTGCNSGLGFETMRVLADRGAQVIGTARTRAKADDAAKRAGGRIVPLVCELTDFETIRACAERLHSQGIALDAVICNAGVLGTGERKTVNGVERHLVVNYLGHFYLVQRLLPLLQASTQGRIVLVSSGLYTSAPKAGIEFENLSGEKAYDRFSAYGQSKLAMILFAEEFARRYPHSSVTANSLYPGVVRTSLFRQQPWLLEKAISFGGRVFLKSPEQGAATQCFVATHPSLSGVTGRLFEDCAVIEPEGPHAGDPVLAGRLWDTSLKLIEAFF